MKFLEKLKNRLRHIKYRRNFYFGKLYQRDVPATLLHYLPDNFEVHAIASTGLRIVDNFCTHEEANYLIETARSQLAKKQVVVDGEVVDRPTGTSASVTAFDKHHQDDRVLPIIARGAMLAGVPLEHVEPFRVTRYRDGEFCDGRVDFGDSFFSDHRLCTMLVYLNDLEPDQGGETYFKDLNVAVRPKAGRAIIWTNVSSDGTTYSELTHAALPPKGADVEKWVIQIWFRPYRFSRIYSRLTALQTRQGIPLNEFDTLPSGTWRPSSANQVANLKPVQQQN